MQASYSLKRINLTHFLLAGTLISSAAAICDPLLYSKDNGTVYTPWGPLSDLVWVLACFEANVFPASLTDTFPTNPLLRFSLRNEFYQLRTCAPKDVHRCMYTGKLSRKKFVPPSHVTLWQLFLCNKPQSLYLPGPSAFLYMRCDNTALRTVRDVFKPHSCPTHSPSSSGLRTIDYILVDLTIIGVVQKGNAKSFLGCIAPCQSTMTNMRPSVAMRTLKRMSYTGNSSNGLPKSMHGVYWLRWEG